jgi:predicted O-methyltransferase YrrM
MSILLKDQAEYLNSFIEEEDPLILEMEEFAREKNIPIVLKDASLFINQLIRIKEPKRVLEIGTAIGYTAINIARNLQGEGMVDTIEISEENSERAIRFIERSGVKENIELITGDALNVIPVLRKRYDIIFLDADKHVYREAFDLSIPLLSEGGVIIVDNLLWHGYAASEEVPEKYQKSTKNIREFNKYFMTLKGFTTSIVPIGDGLGIAIKSKDFN